jgi:excisionase family DNA binding protein
VSASPVHQVAAVGAGDDVFERLNRCDRLLTAKELADILAISPKTLYSYVTRGMIPYFKIESNVRFRAREVSDWLRQHSGQPVALRTGTVSVEKEQRLSIPK